MSDAFTELKPYLASVSDGKVLSFEDARSAFECIMSGRGNTGPDRWIPNGLAHAW